MLSDGTAGWTVYAEWGLLTRLGPGDTYMRRWTESSLNQIMACRLYVTKLSSEPMLQVLLNRPLETNFSEIRIEIHTSLFEKMHLKMSAAKW